MFIVFEGIDGCGKGTQIWKFANYLSSLSKYNHILMTREPYKFREIREILRLPEKPEEKSEKLTKLFVEDRKEHITKFITPSIEKGIIVICDRYKYSTICYQAAQGQEINMLVDLHKNLPAPDIVFVIDVPVKTAINRMKKDLIRNPEQKFEKSSDFLEKVRQNYLKMPELLPEEKIIIINGDKTAEEVFEQIKNSFNSNAFSRI